MSKTAKKEEDPTFLYIDSHGSAHRVRINRLVPAGEIARMAGTNCVYRAIESVSGVFLRAIVPEADLAPWEG